MDPDACLQGLRNALETYKSAPGPNDRLCAADLLAEYFEELDTWLSKGGFAPLAWPQLMPSTDQLDRLRGRIKHAVQNGAHPRLLSRRDAETITDEVVRIVRAGSRA